MATLGGHISYEPPHGKTNNVVSERVWHKPSCTSTEDGSLWLEAGNFIFRK